MAQVILSLKQVSTGADIKIGEEEIISYVEKVAAKASGTATAFAANEVTDAGADFVAAGIAIGDVVVNVTTNDSASVTEVAVDTLTLDADIFSALDDYSVGASYDLEYDKEGATVAFLKAGDSIDKVVAESSNAIKTGDGIYVNANRVITVDPDGTGAKIYYRAKGIDPRIIETTDSEAAVILAINTIP